MQKLSIIGLGKLGACTAACFSSKGFEVIGVDLDKNIVDAINKGESPVYEPGLQELIYSSKDRLIATQDYSVAIRNSDITFIIVPTPSDKEGNFSNKYLLEALTSLSLAFKIIKDKYHLFVIISTVSPRTTEEILIPTIESVSGKKLNQDFGICYNPEFIALGSVINDFLNTDIVLIGESNKTAGKILESIYKTTCESNPCIARMSIISAEITKISFNAYMTMKISFANTLANICEKIPDTDVDMISKALGAEKRISPYYLKGGIAYGGPCFPRDNRAFLAFARKCGIDAFLAEASDKINYFQQEHLLKKVLKYIGSNTEEIIAILGLAYKPNTPVIEESPAIKLIERLLMLNFKIIVYDPLAMDNAKKLFADKILYASSVEECFSMSSRCIITTQAEEFRNIDKHCIKRDFTIIIDCWRMLNIEELGDSVKYIAIGRN